MTRAELIAHLAAQQAQTWPGVRDIEWTPAGPRCNNCARTMRRWAQGYVCGCGAAIDKKGHDDGRL